MCMGEPKGLFHWVPKYSNKYKFKYYYRCIRFFFFIKGLYIKFLEIFLITKTAEKKKKTET